MKLHEVTQTLLRTNREEYAIFLRTNFVRLLSHEVPRAASFSMANFAAAVGFAPADRGTHDVSTLAEEILGAVRKRPAAG